MLYIVSFNHQSASLTIREQLAYASTQQIICNAARENDVELVILNTCNRTELITRKIHYTWLAACLNETLSVHWQDFSTEYYDEIAIEHLLRVAVGLDSMVLGEAQILGQLKHAFSQAAEMGLTGVYLSHLFPFVFSSAKKIRLHTHINTNSLSIAYTAVSLAKNIFTDLQKARVLLIGAGEMITLVAQHLYDIGVENITIANRTLKKSLQLAEKFNATSSTIGDIPNYLADTDIVISCTASQLPLLGKGLLERIIKKRKHKPMLMVDLAMPRDIESEVGDLADVYLYNLDDLKNIVQKNLHRRESAANQAEKIIQLEIQHFKRWQNTLQAIPMIRIYRKKMEMIRDQEIEKALKAIHQGKPTAVVLQRLGHDLTQKLLHAPSVEMRRASYEGRFNLLDWAKQLLHIKM